MMGPSRTLVVFITVLALLRRDSLNPGQICNRVFARKEIGPPRLVFSLFRGFLSNEILLRSLKSSLRLCDGSGEIADTLVG